MPGSEGLMAAAGAPLPASEAAVRPASYRGSRTAHGVDEATPRARAEGRFETGSGLGLRVLTPGGAIAEQDLVGYRIVEAHHAPDERLGLKAERLRPGAIPVWRDAAAPGFKLRDERVVFRADETGQLPL